MSDRLPEAYLPRRLTYDAEGNLVASEPYGAAPEPEVPPAPEAPRGSSPDHGPADNPGR